MSKSKSNKGCRVQSLFAQAKVTCGYLGLRLSPDALHQAVTRLIKIGQQAIALRCSRTRIRLLAFINKALVGIRTCIRLYPSVFGTRDLPGINNIIARTSFVCSCTPCLCR